MLDMTQRYREGMYPMYDEPEIKFEKTLREMLDTYKKDEADGDFYRVVTVYRQNQVVYRGIALDDVNREIPYLLDERLDTCCWLDDEISFRLCG